MPRRYRTIRVVECPDCGGDMTQIYDLKQLGYTDQDWDHAAMLKQYDWFICPVCRTYMRIDMSISSRAFRFLGNSWEKLKELDKIE